MNGLKKSNVELDRSVLADLAVTQPQAFTTLVAQAKAALAKPSFRRATKKLSTDPKRLCGFFLQSIQSIRHKI